jgi:hypothetical protein
VGAVRGLFRRHQPEEGRFKRIVLDQNGDLTPHYPPLYVLPSAQPAITGAKGDLYFDSTANCLMQYTGSAWEQVGATPSGNVTIGGTLDVTGAVALTSTLGVTGRSTLTGNTIATTAGAGITAGSGTIYASSAIREGGIFTTRILIDLTGLNSAATNDIIGVDGGAASCHIGQYTAAVSGTTILSGTMMCLEAPVTGDTDIDLWSADESTGAEDTAISALTGELNMIAAGGAWTIGEIQAWTAFPTANQYFYLTSGGAGASATYTAGKFLIEFHGYA